MKRIALDILVVITLLIIYATKSYLFFPVVLQDLSYKAMLVSLGFMHAHITRKLAFPNVDWNSEGLNAKTLLIISLYVIFIYAYSQGG
ncbi:MAG: hypothetical protein QXW35_05090 [Candidatus Aenigmatarchaeota archaeon]